MVRSEGSVVVYAIIIYNITHTIYSSIISFYFIILLKLLHNIFVLCPAVTEGR